ncbi:MAG: 30S ribosomal protein S20 [Solirubrobacteraceae bacterium]
MANHKSAIKRIRQNERKRISNKYYHKSARTAIRNIRSEKDKSIAEKNLADVISKIDKLAKKNIIHKNKAANLKSKLTKLVAAL